jgi:hypothetical protein
MLTLLALTHILSLSFSHQLTLCWVAGSRAAIPRSHTHALSVILASAYAGLGGWIKSCYSSLSHTCSLSHSRISLRWTGWLDQELLFLALTHMLSLSFSHQLTLDWVVRSRAAIPRSHTHALSVILASAYAGLGGWIKSCYSSLSHTCSLSHSRISLRWTGWLDQELLFLALTHMLSLSFSHQLTLDWVVRSRAAIPRSHTRTLLALTHILSLSFSYQLTLGWVAGSRVVIPTSHNKQSPYNNTIINQSFQNNTLSQLTLHWVVGLRVVTVRLSLAPAAQVCVCCVSECAHLPFSLR